MYSLTFHHKILTVLSQHFSLLPIPKPDAFFLLSLLNTFLSTPLVTGAELLQGALGQTQGELSGLAKLHVGVAELYLSAVDFFFSILVLLSLFTEAKGVIRATNG